MTPVTTDRPVAPPLRSRHADRAPEAEQRARFEHALSRREPEREGKARSGEALTPDPAALGHANRRGFDLMQGGDGRRDRGGRDQEAAMLDGLRPAPVAAAPAAVDALPPLAGAPAPGPGHAAFAARLDLPTQVAGGEFQVSMSDTRWLAGHAVGARASDGGLTLDVATQGNGAARRASRPAGDTRAPDRPHRFWHLKRFLRLPPQPGTANSPTPGGRVAQW